MNQAASFSRFSRWPDSFKLAISFFLSFFLSVVVVVLEIEIEIGWVRCQEFPVSRFRGENNLI